MRCFCQKHLFLSPISCHTRQPYPPLPKSPPEPPSDTLAVARSASRHGTTRAVPASPVREFASLSAPARNEGGAGKGGSRRRVRHRPPTVCAGWGRCPHEQALIQRRPPPPPRLPAAIAWPFVARRLFPRAQAAPRSRLEHAQGPDFGRLPRAPSKRSRAGPQGAGLPCCTGLPRTCTRTQSRARSQPEK